MTPALVSLLETLVEPFGQAFMRRALAEVVLLALVGGALGCWVVLAHLSYAAESLAHGMFPGLVLATLAGAPLLLGGAAGIVVAALAIAFAGRVPGVGRENAVAVAVTALLGLGALLALAADTPVAVQRLLFGDVLASTDGDLLAAAALAAVVLAVLRLAHWRLLAGGFDRGVARSLGVAPGRTDVLLLVLLALAVLVAVQALGNLLVVAILVAPAAAARLLTRRLAPMMAVAVALGAGGGIAGLTLSYHAHVAAGAAIAGVLVAIYLLARLLALMRSHGVAAPSRGGAPVASG